MANILHYSIQ